MKNNPLNLIVIFPGGNYTADMPLLYYAIYKYDLLGYESIKLSYTLPANVENVDDVINDAYESTLQQLKSVDFSKYGEILFVSKSLGTVIAGKLSNRINKDIKHIFLTPIPQAIKYMERNNNVKLVVFGTSDGAINYEQLREHCESENIKYLQIEDVGHRLEKTGDIHFNIDVLKKVVDSY